VWSYLLLFSFKSRLCPILNARFATHLGQTIEKSHQDTSAMTSRRQFIVQFSAASAALGAAQFTQAADPMVAETDPQAKALGYFAVATKTDKTKYPKYAADQNCSNCALYQGKAADAAGGCPLFAGKQVSGKAWCSAWAKKA
jgi:High potential iron-sulfur protein